MTETSAQPIELVGLSDFADAAAVKIGTVAAYKARGYLPPPYAVVTGRSLWTRAQLHEWLRTRPGQGRRRKVSDAAATVGESTG